MEEISETPDEETPDYIVNKLNDHVTMAEVNLTETESDRKALNGKQINSTCELIVSQGLF